MTGDDGRRQLLEVPLLHEIPCEVWKWGVTSAAVVKLGPPCDNQSEVPSAMYGIAVKAKTNGD